MRDGSIAHGCRSAGRPGTARTKGNSTLPESLPCLWSRCQICAMPQLGLRPATSRAQCSPASLLLCDRGCPDRDPPSYACAHSLIARLLHGREYPCNRSRELIPLVRLDRQLSASFSRQAVELRASIVFGG